MAIEIGFRAFSKVLDDHFGPPNEGVVIIDGLGEFDLQTLVFPCGLTVELLRSRGEQCFAGEIDRAVTPSRYTGSTTDDDRAHVAFHLGIPVDTLWTQPPRGYSEQLSAPMRFAVMRLDDNGNEFEVTRTTNRCEAEAIAAMYTTRGHKQTYWVL